MCLVIIDQTLKTLRIIIYKVVIKLSSCLLPHYKLHIVSSSLTRNATPPGTTRHCDQAEEENQHASIIFSMLQQSNVRTFKSLHNCHFGCFSSHITEGKDLLFFSKSTFLFPFTSNIYIYIYIYKRLVVQVKAYPKCSYIYIYFFPY